MAGGAMLTFPILFRDTGLAISTIVLILSGIVSFITCRVYVFHSGKKDKEVESTIKRLLGPDWERYFRLGAGFYLALLCIIYFDLIVDQVYSLILFIVETSGAADAIAEKDTFVFGKFSEQWLTLILVVPVFFLISIKDVSLLIKMSKYGVISPFTYLLFVIYQFIRSAAANEIDISNINWFSFDFGHLLGNSAIAFTVHTTVVTFLKKNKHQENNLRDVGFAYLLVFLFYEIVAILGGFAISGMNCSNTLINCYLKDWTVVIVEVCYLFGLVSVMPCNFEVCRTRLIELFFNKVTPKRFKLFNISFIAIAAVFSLVSPYLPLSLVMSISGAVICFLFIYLVPTLMHHRCLYGVKKDVTVPEPSFN